MAQLLKEERKVMLTRDLETLVKYGINPNDADLKKAQEIWDLTADEVQDCIDIAKGEVTLTDEEMAKKPARKKCAPFTSMAEKEAKKAKNQK